MKAALERAVRRRRIVPPRCALIGLVLLAGCGSTPSDLGIVRAEVTAKHPLLRQVAPAEVAATLDRAGAPLLLDVRTPAEFDVSHLRGARRVDPSATVATLRSGVLAGVPLDAPIVCYCAVGVRSGKTCEALRHAGYRDVANLDGSIFRWANEGFPLVKGTSPTTLVHPYDATWGRMLDPAHRADVPPAE